MQKLVRRFWKALEIVLFILMALMLALVFINVVLRYGLHSGLRSSVELSRMLFVWLTMLGAALTLYHNEHLAITELVPKIMPGAILVISRIIWLSILLCAGMLTVGAWDQMVTGWSNVSQLTGLPSGLFYTPGVLSGIIMGIIAIARIIKPQPWDSENQGGEDVA